MCNHAMNITRKIITIFISHLILLASLLFWQSADADNQQMNVTLVQLINQINAMMPLIDTAEKQQDKKMAVTFQFDTFTDATGKQHNGLRQDLLAIRAALIAQINEPAIEPRVVPPLSNDYVRQAS